MFHRCFIQAAIWLMLVQSPPSHADALFDAVTQANLQAIEIYLKAGGDPNATVQQTPEPDRQGALWEGTPLELAIIARADDIALTLLKNGADIGLAKNALGAATLLAAAAEQGMPKTARFLIERDPKQILEGEISASPIVLATTAGRAEIVDEIIAASERHNLVLGDRLDFALGKAAFKGNNQLAWRLLAAGAVPSIPGTLNLAVSNLNPAIVADMLAAGADPSLRSMGWRPLDDAVDRMERSPGADATAVLGTIVSVTPESCQPIQQHQSSPLSKRTLSALHDLAPQCDWASLVSNQSD
jgi:hypothetical protein